MGMRRYMDKRVPSNFKIQITSMVDMFVILLVFLLKSFSTSPVQITPNKDLSLPDSTSMVDPVDVVKLVVSKSGVFIEDKKVIAFETPGQISPQDIDDNDARFIPELYQALDKQAGIARDIAKVNETVEFDGKILMQADKDLPYELLQKVMYTAMLAGYADMKLAVFGQ